MSAASPTASAPSDQCHSEQCSRLQQLPSYARSLLKITVPVTVTLASSKRSVHRILQLVPGSILQFEKLCDDMLTLEVGGQPVAQGETVKVGDKFGLRVTSMLLPGERFERVTGSKNDQPKGEATDAKN
jgi:flagellar motor switch protein FliN/FliY